MLRSLEDPRSGDALAAYIGTNPPPHWKTEAGLRLAEIGDLRSVPTLAWRMKQDPLNLYNKDLDPDYRQDDNERVVSARMLADLAVVNPDKRPEIRAEAYDGVYYWMTNKPQPHANALRFMAAADAKVPPWQVSFKGALQTLANFLPLLAASMPLDAGCRTLLDLVASHVVGQRPDRYEPRRIKRRPKPQALLMMPRSEYKRLAA